MIEETDRNIIYQRWAPLTLASADDMVGHFKVGRGGVAGLSSSTKNVFDAQMTEPALEYRSLS